MGILENFREVLVGLKRRKLVLKLCPKCKSPKLRFSTRFDTWLTPEQYVCENCGYGGPVVMEIAEEGEQGTE